MAQIAMQQAMDEITDYLAVIDEKVEDILRAQKDTVLTDMVGVGALLDGAMLLRKQTRHVSGVTWSKIQNSSFMIERTQAYALSQLDGIADKIEEASKAGDIADAATKASASVQEWLGVLARCFQLQDAEGILELDRVFDAPPDELDQHRRSLALARDTRRERIAKGTQDLITRMNDAASRANTKVLFRPRQAPEAAEAANDVAQKAHELEQLLGIGNFEQTVDKRRWVEVAAATCDGAVKAGAQPPHPKGRTRPT